MFAIVTYDVGAKRVGKVMRICRKYLNHEQRSVFEGRLSEAELRRLKAEILKTIDFKEDSFCIYALETVRYAKKEKVGLSRYDDNVI